ncbi:MAG: hypothetical protein COX62_01060 [Deltaproteobacteria bacterium CG_4_10_14_0_2_um_filter_43_8]|nr:MAG: hypothetical protein COV43_02265 [Deltaproteobacteria bacterium CG11_big_fil_rev_8_21_14_0_20_42_23]PJA21957.1 MAG: hypothetical protein COX62_01060 [Deltaproteobacteria bacterium CG_4_10_14_0_2_um_filter_43_8]PJC64750.1 MAG: hypothetical protein CO021_02800 [Deltaproteobacteria bacterium CG_4_9_14_0_2_um_filter_42_21]
MKRFVTLLFLSFFVVSSSAFASQFDDGMKLLKEKKLEESAKMLSQFAQEHPRESNAAQALAVTARILDLLQDTFSERAEKKCYWGSKAPSTPACMRDEAKRLNEIYGKNAFDYIGGTSVAYIAYTGSHYKTVLKRHSKSTFVDEAEFYQLLLKLEGHPDKVLPRIEKFQKQHPSGEWNRKARLLWARVNEDVSFIWRKWTWVLFNGKITEDELIVRSAPYQRAAIAAYTELAKQHAATVEGRMAAEELKQLQATGDNGNVISITNDASATPWSKWGVTLSQ